MRKRIALSGILIALIASGSMCNKPKGYRYDPDTAVYHKFSGDLALEHVATMVGFGPRPAGSDALEGTRKYVEAQLKQFGWTSQRQSFEEDTPKNGTVQFVNIRARYGGKSAADKLWTRPFKLLVGSHYDTKLYDNFQFLGANDSGSSTGALLEIARVTASTPNLAESLELVFFDGEEAFGSTINDSDGLYGSRYYAKQLRKQDSSQHPKHGLILDMIGDKNLNVGVPADSPRQLFAWLTEAAHDLGHEAHFGKYTSAILDDHVPLNAIGIPTLDIIDLDFEPWHTAGDTLDQVSADSLQIVGSTTLLMIEKYILGNEF